MHIILFGGSGMVGQGVLRECLLAPDVERVTSVLRAPTGQAHAKLREIIHQDFTDFSPIEPQLAGADACFYCLGISSVGTTDTLYRRVTLDFTEAAATSLARVNPEMTFVFVSGRSTDSTEKGSVMWARVKGIAENVVLRTFPKGYAMRPGIIQPMHGVRSKTMLYRIFYTALAPVLFLLRPFKALFTTTERVGQVMLAIARHGYPKRILENEDINRAT